MPKYGFLKRTSRNKTKDEQHWRWGKKISSPYLIIQHYDSFDNSNDDTIIRNLSPLQYNNQIQCPFSSSSSQFLSSCPHHRDYKEISTTSMVNTSTVTSSTSTITSYSNSNGNTDGGKEENDDDTYYRHRLSQCNLHRFGGSYSKYMYMYTRNANTRKARKHHPVTEMQSVKIVHAVIIIDFILRERYYLPIQ